MVEAPKESLIEREQGLLEQIVRVLVSGLKGMLAHDLIPILKKDHDVIAPSEEDFDITLRGQALNVIKQNSPDIVVNCAGYTNVDKAEEQQSKAFLVNGTGVQNLALACESIGVPLCHISTDYVFNGSGARPYTPFDNTDPINVYGRSKLAGERYIQWIMRKFYIIRTSWLYGKAGNNFVSTILRLAKEKSEIRVVQDQRGSPTSTLTLSNAIEKLITTGAYGIFHLTDRTEGGICWYDFAKEIVSLSGLTAKVVPVATAEFPRPAKRPEYSVLDIESFSAATSHQPPYWVDSLKDYLDNYLQGHDRNSFWSL